MGGQVIRLVLREQLGHDGEIAAPEPGRNCAADELQALSQAMLRCYLREDFRGFDAGLRRVMRLAPELGLSGLGRVSADVRHCLYRRDGTALAATWGRLSRLLEQALMRRP